MCGSLISATLNGKFGFHPTCKKIQLTHLSFADDLLIFSDASPKSLEGIKVVLSLFSNFSGLKVNYTKSEFFCNNTSVQQQLAAILGIKVGKLPVRYLGVLLISGRLTAADCRVLTDKIVARTKSWTTRFLSFAGRLQLILSVLASMTNHWCNVFL